MKYSIVISVSQTKFGAIVLKGDLLENIIKAKNYGYDGVEFAVKDPNKINISETKLLLKNSDLIVPVIGTGQLYVEEGLSFSNPDKYIRNKAVERVKEIINLASNFNSHVIIGLVRGNIVYGPGNLEIAETRICECLQKCLSEKYSVNLLIEPMNSEICNIFNKIEDATNFLNKFKDKLDINRIGILADTFHMNMEEHDIQESFNKYFHQVEYIHFSDSNRKAPGYGNINFNKIVKVLKQNHYNGFVSFEILPYPDPDTCAKYAIEYIKKIENKIETEAEQF